MRLGSSAQERLARTAHELAGAVRSQESAELARLVADTGQARPAEVGFRQPELLYWRTDGGRHRGSLSQVRGYYQGLGQGRLVVLGPAGAGKTVLAIQLVHDLAAAHIAAAHIAAADGGAPGGSAGGKRIPVPVRLSASAFDPAAGTGLTDMTAGDVAKRLDAWVAEQLSTVYGVKPQQARGLVADGLVLPVLDGVDEMDPPGRPPQRAAALLAALNQPTAAGLRPVVLTCHTDRYTHLSTGQDAVGGRQVVQDTTVVEVEPLTAAAARQYLIYRFPDPAGSEHGETRWRPVLDRLATDRAHDPLVTALRSPLRLFLAVAGYRAPATEPAELTGHRDANSLDDHLFGALVPAATAHHPQPGGGSYSPEQVTRWLTTLARHLRKEDLAGRSGTDLLLHELWTSAGQLPRYLSALIITLASAASAALGLQTDFWVAQSGDVLVPLLLLCVGAIAMTAWRSSRPTVGLRRFDLGAVRTARTRRQLAVWFVIATVIILVIQWGWLLSEPVDWPPSEPVGWPPSEFVNWILFGLVIGLMFGLPFWLVRALEARPQVIDSPHRLVSHGISHIVGMLALALAPSLMSALISEFASELVFAPVLGVGLVLAPVLVVGLAPVLVLGLVLVLVIVLGLAVGLVLAPEVVLGLVVGFVIVATSPWPRYLVACLLLARRHELPRRPAVFLDWAYEAGLMRLAGIAVQFRHREFQDWLTRSYAPAAATSPSFDHQPHTMEDP